MEGLGCPQSGRARTVGRTVGRRIIDKSREAEETGGPDVTMLGIAPLLVVPIFTPKLAPRTTDVSGKFL